MGRHLNPVISRFFNNIMGGNPLDRVPVIGLAENGVAVSMPSILVSGIVPNGEGLDANYKPQDLTVDLRRDDAYANAVNQASKDTIEKIKQNFTLQTLLKKDSWDIYDRKTWERLAGEIATNEAHHIPGLETYRTTVFKPGDASYDPNNVAQARSLSLNDLSDDIEHGTKKMDYSCARSAVTVGAILQRAEHAVLPATGRDDDFKKVGYWYYATANVNYQPANSKEREFGKHAFLISSVTGNIQETTVEGGTFVAMYKESAVPSYSFKDFVAGKPFIDDNTEFPTYYQASTAGKDEVIQNRLTDIANFAYGNLEWDLSLRRSEYTEVAALNKYIEQAHRQGDRENVELGIKYALNDTKTFNQSLMRYLDDPLVSQADEAKKVLAVRPTQDLSDLVKSADDLIGNSKNYFAMKSDMGTMLRSWEYVARLAEKVPDLGAKVQQEYAAQMDDIMAMAGRTHDIAPSAENGNQYGLLTSVIQAEAGPATKAIERVAAPYVPAQAQSLQVSPAPG